LMDDKVRNVQDIHPLTDSPILATIPAEKSDHAVMPMPDLEGHGRNAEAYRELRTNLRYLGMRCRLRSMLVTSSVKGEGKSVTSINLASTLARSGRRVLLIDADLRAPSLHRHLTLQSEAGLTTVLLGEAALDDVVQPVELDGLSVLTTGPAPPNPSELLDSDQMTLLKAATARYDTLIVDSAPLLAVADRTALTQRVSGTLMVVGSGRVRRPHLAQALRKLEIVQLPILGIVLNRVPRRGLSAYSEPYGVPAESARNLAGVSHSGRRARTMTSAPDSSTSTSSVPGPSERKRTS
ncbi:MAG TPA: CpsD/CapB family tyrosine-protein kinase, partial [Candidatus Brachybacterium merdavium]|nr:CpsD/CapB family tyrosine-protein kinase [Candidatus Brachybacterium merdavium]